MAEYDTETASLIAAAEARLANLRNMRSSGVLSTRHGDTMVQFQSIGDLQRAINAEIRDINKLKGVVPKPFYVFEPHKGL